MLHVWNKAQIKEPDSRWAQSARALRGPKVLEDPTARLWVLVHNNVAHLAYQRPPCASLGFFFSDAERERRGGRLAL